MRTLNRRLLLIHVATLILLLVTWSAGVTIKTESGTPFVALYYVLHIFPGSVIFILILFEWLARKQEPLMQVPRQKLANRVLHRAYYLILLALPVTGIAVFFDYMTARPTYLLHKILFDLLLLLILLNILHMMTVRFAKK